MHMQVATFHKYDIFLVHECTVAVMRNVQVRSGLKGKHISAKACFY